MIWVDRDVKKLKERHLSLEWVDDMKTPSGRIHVGALRGVVIHDLVYKVLVENDVTSRFSYVFDDHDPMDAIPSYLDRAKWEKYAGAQLYKIPSPVAGYKSFAQYYAQEFQAVFEAINCHPEIIWASELYLKGKMNGVIKEILDATPKIREIYFRVSKIKRPNDWYPFNVACEKCGKIGTTYVYKWDGEFVYYQCRPQMVAWAKGCGHEGKISPFDGNGKLPWKVEWAAKWKVIGVTVEGAGKDHMSAGGSHDIASHICSEVLHYPVPYPIPYEWFTIGGRKMSSSKGVGVSAKEVAQILPADILRFLIVRTPIERAIDFNPYGDTIPNLFDDYDRHLEAYFAKIEGTIPKGKKGEVLIDFARIIELSQVLPLPEKRLFLPRFRTVVNLVKTKTDILNFFEGQKKAKLTDEEKRILEERVVYAQVYLKNYTSEKAITEEKVTKEVKLSPKQKDFVHKLAEELELEKPTNRDEIQGIFFNVLKTGNFQAKEAFQGFYLALTGKNFGPKAADLILDLGIEKAVKRLEQY